MKTFDIIFKLIVATCGMVWLGWFVWRECYGKPKAKRCKDCKWHSGPIFLNYYIGCEHLKVHTGAACGKDGGFKFYVRKWHKFGRPK